jgi:hypothetical protein
MPEAHQFDFWIGDWDVTPWQAPPSSNPRVIGTNRIEALLEHCLIMETSADSGRSWQPGFDGRYVRKK